SNFRNRASAIASPVALFSCREPTKKLRAALLVPQRRPSFFVSLNLSNLQRGNVTSGVFHRQAGNATNCNSALEFTTCVFSGNESVREGRNLPKNKSRRPEVGGKLDREA